MAADDKKPAPMAHPDERQRRLKELWTLRTSLSRPRGAPPARQGRMAADGPRAGRAAAGAAVPRRQTAGEARGRRAAVRPKREDGRPQAHHERQDAGPAVALLGRLVGEGKLKKVALVAVMRKLLCLLRRIAQTPDFIPAST